MPLNLGGVETSRPQLITWNPAIAQEAKEAIEKRTALIAEGFIPTKESAGEIHLDPPPRGPDIGVFRVLSQNGDDRIVWDRNNPKQVKEAYAKFKDLMAKGYTAYATLGSGKKGHKITEFDPGLQEIICVPNTMPG